MKIEIRHGGDYDPRLGRDHPDNFDPTLEAKKSCELVDCHHPDCECVFCKAMQDVVCGKPSVGITTEGRVRVCEECARIQEGEGFTVDYDKKQDGTE